MDAFSALDAAASILGATELAAKLLTARYSPKAPSPSLAGRGGTRKSEIEIESDRDGHFTLAGLEKTTAALCDLRITAASTAPPQSPESASAQAVDTAVLQELCSLRDTGAALLQELVDMFRTDAHPWLRPRLTGTAFAGDLEKLAIAVTQQVNALLKARMAEAGQVVDLLESDNRQFTRPEHEPRIHAASRDLEALRLEMEKRAANPHTNDPAAFTEADVRFFRVRLAGFTEAEDALLADRIVSSLNYASRPVRLDSVPRAHRDTFQWAFDSRLAGWLRSGSGTFWVSGKPGSGKSTFMKFISKHPQTKELLTAWAGSSDKLSVACHFFWIAGTPIQKSWPGLLQSLLFDILRGRPNLIAMVSPYRWAAAKAGRWQAAAEPWSVTELAATLHALATAADRVSLKICLFIDGLDEYDSNHDDFCDVLRDMARSRYIKLCLSSRPWPVFKRSFGGDGQESLDIHNLTQSDIRRFGRDQLQAHPRWAAAVSDEARRAKAELVDRIVTQADGVFLWAFFVTQSLREALSRGYEIKDLSQRVGELPSDLDRLFRHMLETVSAADHPAMAGILQAAIHALEPLHVDLYWHLENASGLGAPAPLEDGVSRRDQTVASINDKTKGLLRLVDSRVEFLHRTVKDFVLTKDIDEYLRSKLPADYNGFVSIAAAYLGFLQMVHQNHQNIENRTFVFGIVRLGPGQNSGPFIAHLNQALRYAAEALKQPDLTSPRQHQQTEALLDAYEDVVADMVRLGKVTVGGIYARDCDARLFFRAEMLRHDLTPYLARKMREQPGYLDVLDESPLFAALTPMSIGIVESRAPVPGVLDVLLRYGYNPNVRPRQTALLHTADKASPWVLFARGTMSVFNMLSGPCMFPALRFSNSLKDSIFGRLMAHGADPNMPLLDRKGARTAFSHFLDISLSKFLGEECFEDYLTTLDDFLQAGASLGVPDFAGIVGPDAETAFGNLARRWLDESVLSSFCTLLSGLLAKLAADPHRAAFVSTVIKKLIRQCAGNEDNLRELASAVAQGCPADSAAPLLRRIASERVGRSEQALSRKRLQSNDGGGEASESRVKHPRHI
ncbi:hypothetical protein SEUCBS139899_003856 [Sporothrix eucalyptigena]|uniref:NACHT domain-containing protein n=1 Tax=Sporothrix eucalyptigena TaxID=1812306 RepID=A0ABP0D259_9PEZI